MRWRLFRMSGRPCFHSNIRVPLKDIVIQDSHSYLLLLFKILISFTKACSLSYNKNAIKPNLLTKDFTTMQLVYNFQDAIYEEENPPTTLYAYASVAPPAPKRFKRSTNQLENTEERCRADLLDLACDKLRESYMENDVISKYWANELKYLEPDQKLFAQKAINDILFEARMKTLDRYSVQINRVNLNHTS